MRIKQLANTNITINRFDGQGQITFEPNVETTVDDATGNYLLKMKAFDDSGVLCSNFIQV